MGQRRRQTSDAQLDQLRALLLRADALRAGYEERLAAPPRTRQVRGARTPTRPAPTYGVDVSVEKQRLSVTMRGFLDFAQAELLLADLRAALATLRPGFDVITDVSRLGTVTPAAFPLLRRAATAYVEAGMRRMVRVVGSAQGAATSVARAAEGLYEARVVASAAEAAHLLDGELAGN